MPGAAPTPPYDHAGWTLAFQMGVEFDRILDGFTGPFEPVTDWNVKPPAGKVTAVAGGGRLPDSAISSSIRSSRSTGCWPRTEGRLYWLPRRRRWYVVRPRPSTRAALEKIAAELGVGAEATSGEAAGRRAEAAAAARRAVGSVRRLDGFRLGAVDSRAVPVPVREGVSADARRRQPQREVRRARVRRGRHPGDRRRRGRRAAGGRRHSGGVSADARDA